MDRLSWRRGANESDKNERKSKVFRRRSGPQASFLCRQESKELAASDKAKQLSSTR